MPQIVDTTIRLLSQDPLAGKLPTGEVLRIAEILDTAGLRTSRSRAAACSTRPSGSPSRARGSASARSTRARRRRSAWRSAAGSSPARDPCPPTSCAASSPARPTTASTSSGCTTRSTTCRTCSRRARRSSPRARSSTSASSTAPAARARSTRSSSARSSCPRSERRASSSTIRPTRSCRTSPRSSSSASAQETGLPVGLFVQGAAGTGLLNAVVATRVGADLIATAIYPLALTLHRVSGESLVDALHGLGRETGVDTAPLWEACDLVDEHIGDQPVAPVAPRIAVRAAEYDLPAGLVAALDVHLRAHAAGDRLLDTLTEVVRIRAESGWPPLASPIGQILASQALLNVLSARRYGTVLDEFRMLVEGAYGTTPAPIEESVSRAVALVTGSGGGLDEDPPSAEDVREAAEGLAASEEDLVLLAMFGQEAETAAAVDPPAAFARDVAAARRRRRDAGRADPRARQDRAGVRRRRDRDRGRGHARLGPAGRRGRRSRRAARRDPRGRRGRPPEPRPRDDAGRVADGGRLLPVVVARERPRSSRSATSSASARRCACSRR